MAKVLTKKEFALWTVAALTVAGVSIYSDRNDAALMSSLKEGEDRIVAILSEKTNIPASEGGEAIAEAAAAKIDELSSKVKTLEKRSEWRKIDDADAVSIITALKAVGPHTAYISTIAGDQEALRYAKQIVSILRAGNWNVPGSQPMEGIWTGLKPGLKFLVNPNPPFPESVAILSAIFARNQVDFDHNGAAPDGTVPPMRQVSSLALIPMQYPRTETPNFEQARWRRSQIAETFASIRVSAPLTSAAARCDFILLFLEARIVGRDAFFKKKILSRACGRVVTTPVQVFLMLAFLGGIVKVSHLPE